MMNSNATQNLVASTTTTTNSSSAVMIDPSQIPVISLAGITCLTDVLSELPIPTPFPDIVLGPTETLYFHQRVADEAQKYENSNDPTLLSVVSSKLWSVNVDHLVLKDEYAAAASSSNNAAEEILSTDGYPAPGLLKNVLRANPGIFAPRSGEITKQSPQSSHDPNLAAAASMQRDDASQSRSADSSVGSIKVNDDGEIPEHLKHLFREEPVIRALESMDDLRAGVVVGGGPRPGGVGGATASESMKKRLVSIGKQPKPSYASTSASSMSNNSKKKRGGTMVSELFDSLTPAAEYFAEGSRRRRRAAPKNYHERQNADGVVMELHSAADYDSGSCDSPADYAVQSEQGVFVDAAGNSWQKPPPIKKQRRDSKSHHGRGDEVDSPYEPQADPERPLTPTEVEKEREKEWQEILKKRREKRRRRTERAGGVYQIIDPNELVENESYRKFCAAIDTVFDNAEDVDISAETADDEDEIPAECLIPKHVMMELCMEANKLKVLGAMNRVPIDRLTKLITVLEKNVKDGAKALPYLDEKADSDESVAFKEAMTERVLRSADAALIAMTIMTSPAMPKPVFIEDAIERSVAFVKFQLQNVVFPAFDPLYRAVREKSKGDGDNADSSSTSKQKRSRGSATCKNKTLQLLYGKISELIGCFADLVEALCLTDTTVLQLSSLGVTPFFVENIGVLQLHALRLVANIFARYPKHRKLILDDILASLARLPSTKRGMRNYRLSANEYIQMVSALVMQLVQSVVRVPSTSKSSEYEGDGQERTETEDPDVVVNTSFDSAMRTAHTFMSAYLKKCTTKSEEDYRPLFEAFVEDLLTAVHKPDWPAAELLLSLLGNLLVQHFSNKNIEMSLRVASLDYLGVVASRLRKDAVASQLDEPQLHRILRTLMEGGGGDDEEEGVITTGTFESKRIKIRFGGHRPHHHETSNNDDKIQTLQKALMDYLTEQNDTTVEFAKSFYIAQWYRDCAGESAKTKSKSGDENEPCNNDEQRANRKEEKRQMELEQLDIEAQERIMAKKSFLLSLTERELNKDYGSKLRHDGSLLSEQEAAFLVRYLASKRPLSQSFDIYLAQILRVLNETAVAVRTKAIKCLSAVVEADPSVLGRADIQQAVRARLLDTASSVREAAVDLIGKFICAQPDFIDKYYEMIMDRILDTGVSVRKRVIKILKDICDRRPDFEKIPEICVRILKRANDEESVKKLVVETFHGLWFLPVRDRDTVTLMKKVMTIIDVISEYGGQEVGCTYDGFEALLASLLRKDAACEKGALTAAQQIVDCLVENVLTSEERSLEDRSRMSGHTRLLSCLTTLYLFSKVRPLLMLSHAETMQPYLLMECKSRSEQAVLVQVVKILEMVVPLIPNPNPDFLHELEQGLIKLSSQHGPHIVQACISCLSALINKQEAKSDPSAVQKFDPSKAKKYHLIQTQFFRLFHNLLKIKNDVECKPDLSVPREAKPSLLRGLFTLGLYCRYFDLDKTYPEDKKPEVAWKDQVFRAFMFFTGIKEEDVKLKSLAALGSLCIQHPDFMLDDDLKRLYCSFLLLKERSSKAPQNEAERPETFDEKGKWQVLKNIEQFLKEEEATLMKSNEQWDNSKQSEDLKDLGEASSGSGSSVIQHYLRGVQECYFHTRSTVRAAVCDVVILTLTQGLVHPVQCIPHVIAMQTDLDQNIRNKGDKILKEVETKYPGFIQMKAAEGLQLSFRLQTIVCRDERQQKIAADGKQAKSRQQQPAQLPGAGARGLRCDPSSGPQALNSQLYALIRHSRQQRRAFLRGLMQMFDENAKTSLEEMIYVADNLSSFPFQILDEPLFICHHVDIIVTVTGASLLKAFQEGLLPKSKPVQQPPPVQNVQYDPSGGMQAMYYGMEGMVAMPPVPPQGDVQGQGVGEDDDDDDTAEEVLARLPGDCRPLEAIMSSGQGCIMLLSLKQYLKDIYGITDSKLQEYSPNESVKAYDKALNRRPTTIPFQPRYFQIGIGAWNSQMEETERRFQLCRQYIEFKQMTMSIDVDKSGYVSDEDNGGPSVDQGTSETPVKKRKSKGGKDI